MAKETFCDRFSNNINTVHNINKIRLHKLCNIKYLNIYFYTSFNNKVVRRIKNALEDFS